VQKLSLLALDGAAEDDAMSTIDFGQGSFLPVPERFEKGPADIAEAYAWTYENVLFPAWQKLVHGRGIEGYIEELELTQWMRGKCRACERS